LPSNPAVCPLGTPDPAIVQAAGDLVPHQTYVAACPSLTADERPSGIGPIRVAADDRTLVFEIAWVAGCVELSHVTVSEKPAEVDVAVYYGKPSGPIARSPGASPVTVTCPYDAGFRPGNFFTVAQLAAPVAGRKIVDLGGTASPSP
jgi:hypothetical protein